MAGFPHLLLFAFPKVSFGIAILVATSSNSNSITWSSMYQNTHYYAGQLIVLAELVP